MEHSFYNLDPITKSEKKNFERHINNLVNKLQTEQNEALREETAQKLQRALEHILSLQEPVKKSYKDYVRKIFGTVHGPMKIALDELWRKYKVRSKDLARARATGSRAPHSSHHPGNWPASLPPSGFAAPGPHHPGNFPPAPVASSSHYMPNQPDPRGSYQSGGIRTSTSQDPSYSGSRIPS
ncbi:hypothetical protein B0H11DRAFT_2207926, partial [Mycena galericulata]